MAGSEEQAEAPGAMFSIDRSEFDRLQMQLIELRTTNYQLKEQHAKKTTELSQLQQTVQSQTRELEKANKTIQRSKKAKEFSTLVEENDGLQRKLERQEEDFRLQNMTLMGELSKVCEEKDKLAAEFERAKKGGGLGGDLAADQVTHLQAKNAALMKSMQALKEQMKESTNDSDEADSSVPSSEKVLELELRLSTEEEEKRLLQNKMAELQEVSRKQELELRNEVEKWTDKAKKKQDSLVQLQEEKERQFHENRSAFDEMVRTKDHQIQSLRSNLEQLQKDLDAKNEASEMSHDIAKQLESLANSNEEYSLRSTTLMQEREVLVKEKADLQQLLSELGAQLQQTKALITEEGKAKEDLAAQLEEAKLSQEQLADQVVRTSEEKHKLTVELQAATKLAEKRKNILDEMAIKEQESMTEQQKKTGEIEEKYKEDISKLEELLQHEQSRNWKLNELVEEVPPLRQELQEEKKKVESLEGRVKELEVSLHGERIQSETKMSEITASHQEENKRLEEELKTYQVQLTDSQAELEQCQERIKGLECAVEDKEEAVRIMEKKSQNLLKDLKRQVQQMQKREERSQEQMAELRGAQALDMQRELSHDAVSSTHSRESSLSSMRGLIRTSENSEVSGAMASLPSPQGGGVITEETEGLLARIAELQKEKWALEEKVHHLENTGSALAEDVIKKSEIIKTYLMDTKADHQPQAKHHSMIDKLSPMKLMPWARNKEETLEEINRKTQRALEEALMKNIHLQENVEMLSCALEKADKETAEKHVPDNAASNSIAPVSETENS